MVAEDGVPRTGAERPADAQVLVVGGQPAPVADQVRRDAAVRPRDVPAAARAPAGPDAVAGPAGGEVPEDDVAAGEGLDDVLVDARVRVPPPHSTSPVTTRPRAFWPIRTAS